MGAYTLLRIVCRFLLPFIMLFGFHVIIGGDLSPGGGFQGGVVLVSTYLLIHFLSEENTLELQELVWVAKLLFFLLLLGGCFHDLLGAWLGHTGYLLLKNALIGGLVMLGMGAIVTIFLEEGTL